MSEEKKEFGIKNDGWDKNDLGAVLEICETVKAIDYEIQCCRRGSYGVVGDTVEDLVVSLKSMEENLKYAIEFLEEKLED